MKTVKVTLTRKVKFQAEIKLTDAEFELIQNLDNDDVEMYDPGSIRTLENGQRVISSNPQYEILQYLDSEQNEVEREETIFDVTVEEL